MNIIKKIKHFQKLDLRWKLRTIGKFLNFEIYPTKYPEGFFQKLKFKFIFNLILNRKAKLFKKYHFKNLELQDSERFVLSSLPRSGTHWVMNTLKSYFEIIYNIGDGNLKYDPLNDSFKSNIPQNIFDIYNGIDSFSESSNPTILEKFNFNIINNVGHYPLNQINLQNAKEMNFIILLRHPIDACYSRFLMDISLKNEKHDSENSEDFIENNKLNLRINQVIRYFKFWNEIDKKKRENKLLFIFYEDLLKNTNDEIHKILNFANIKVDDQIISRSVELNSKDEIKKKILINQKSLRISNLKNDLDENKIKKFIGSEFKKVENIFFNYKL